MRKRGGSGGNDDAEGFRDLMQEIGEDEKVSGKRDAKLGKEDLECKMLVETDREESGNGGWALLADDSGSPMAVDGQAVVCGSDRGVHLVKNANSVPIGIFLDFFS